MKEMREWKFENGIKVYEMDHDHDLHKFDVYSSDDFLGSVYPADIDIMEDAAKQMDDGIDPITGCWEDGFGHCCSLDGWDD